MRDAKQSDNRSGPLSLPVRKHLRRLDCIYVPGAPIYYITICVEGRREALADPRAATILAEALRHALPQHSWLVGRYVIMPDHIHFFATPQGEKAKTLSAFVGYWKRSSAIRLRRIMTTFTWQREFFDHLMRNEEAYAEKYDYVRRNPVRAGLVRDPEDWPYQGEIEVIRW